MGSLTKVVEDCFGLLQVYSDGSVRRVTESNIDFGDHINHSNNNDNKNNNISVSEDGSYVEWEDCIFDEQNKLYLRVYKPNNNDMIGKRGREKRKLAIMYYIRGGGFCLGSRTWPNCHNCCLRLSSQLQALVIAPDYRLAPEHRLPAAIEDGLNAVKWVKVQAQLREEKKNHNEKEGCCRLLDDDGVDFDQVFIVGDSSGGNVAHHLAVQLGSGSPTLKPVRVQGYVLLAPFFGGVLRTNSEGRGPPEPILDLPSLDRFWRLSLPIGETRDHPFANPFGPTSPKLEMVSLDPMLIIVGGKEILKDRVKDYAQSLRELGKDITFVELEGQHHGFLTDNPYSDVSNQVFQLLKKFMFGSETSC